MRGRALLLALLPVAFAVLSVVDWHPAPNVRKATALVVVTLVLWISEIAPLGVIALLVPVVALLADLLTWSDAIAAWGDPVVFLFLGAFLLARALEKHGVFDPLVHGRWARAFVDPGGRRLVLIVLLLAGALSTFQNNTAVAALLLPAVTLLAQRTAAPASVLLALAYGATFGGTATPVGTAPNFLGFAEIKKLDPGYSFLSWLAVGVPAWLGTSAIGAGVLALNGRPRSGPGAAAAPRETARPEATPPAPDRPPAAPRDAARGDPAARRWAIAAFALTAAVWLSVGLVQSIVPAALPLPGWLAALVPDAAAERLVAVVAWTRAHLPESVVPMAAALALFLVRAGPARAPLLDRRDFQALDWDTLFLIAGGLCLGKVMAASGLNTELAGAVARAQLSPLPTMLLLAGATVLLSELTSNTATAALMVPIAAAIAPAAGLAPVQSILLVALSASLGFALPVSTPPNALVYGTRLVPLRFMIVSGLAVDVLCVAWVVGCVWWLG